MRNTIIMAIGIAISSITCHPPTELDKRHDEVMVIHDEVMPKMKDIYRLSKELKKLPPSETTQKLLADLEEADEAMMDWMRAYKKPSAKNQEAFQYLDSQTDLVNIVKTKMLTSIANAQNHLENEQ